MDDRGTEARFYEVTMPSTPESITVENGSLIIERLILNDVEGSGRGRYQGTIPAFTWRD
jgi:hypothetical protein